MPTICFNLERFLEKEGALDAFRANFEEDTPKFVDNIADAFVWIDTPEGWDYWLALEKEYING